MTRHRAISQVLIIAALLAAMGTDTLAQAGVAVRADAVANVTERMANRLSRAFARQVTQSAVRYQDHRRPEPVAEQSRPAPELLLPTPLHQHEHLLYLPPPVLA